MTSSKFTIISRILCSFILIGFSSAIAQEQPNVNEKTAEGNKAIFTPISKVVVATYKAMEEQKSKDVLSYHHPKSNMEITIEELDNHFAQYDIKFTITNLRYIDNDKENYVVIFNEKREMRFKGKEEIIDQQAADIVMVLRKDQGKFKIYNYFSLRPGK